MNNRTKQEIKFIRKFVSPKLTSKKSLNEFREKYLDNNTEDSIKKVCQYIYDISPRRYKRESSFLNIDKKLDSLLNNKNNINNKIKFRSKI